MIQFTICIAYIFVSQFQFVVSLVFHPILSAALCLIIHYPVVLYWLKCSHRDCSSTLYSI